MRRRGWLNAKTKSKTNGFGTVELSLGRWLAQGIREIGVSLLFGIFAGVFREDASNERLVVETFLLGELFEMVNDIDRKANRNHLQARTAEESFSFFPIYDGFVVACICFDLVAFAKKFSFEFF